MNDDLWNAICKMAEDGRKPRTKRQQRLAQKQAKRKPLLEQVCDPQQEPDPYAFLRNSKWKNIEIVLFVYEQRCPCCHTTFLSPNRQVLLHRQHPTLGDHYCENILGCEMYQPPRRIVYRHADCQICPDCLIAVPPPEQLSLPFEPEQASTIQGETQ